MPSLLKRYLRIIKRKDAKNILMRIAIVLFMLSLSLFFFKQFISVLITLMIIIIASLSKVYKHITHFSIGFELVTLASIIFFFTHGFTLGLVLSLLMLILSTLVSGRFSQMLAIQFMIYFIIGFMSIFLKGLGIIYTGKILILTYNILLHATGLLLLRMPIHSSIINFTVNITASFVFLDLFGEWLTELL